MINSWLNFKIMRHVYLYLLICLFFSSCNFGRKQFQVSDIQFLTNLNNDSLIHLSLDMNNAVLNGIEIPTANQTKNGYFNFSFKIKNTSGQLQKFLYKIYYQNESYKFNDTLANANENFYGSWGNGEFIFKPTKLLAPNEEIEIKDSFKIVGNPRDEKIFYGAPPFKFMPTKERMQSIIKYINSEPKWMNSIKEKAIKNKISFNEQQYADALWTLNDQRQRDTTSNNRWKRNPRVGTYKFMLVATTYKDLEKMPTEIIDITQKDTTGKFVNPFGYYANFNKSKLKNTVVVNLPKKIKVNAKIDFSKGIYVNPEEFSKENFTKTFYKTNCNDSIDLYKKAQIDIFIHHINRDFIMHNIPEIRDITGENYTRKEYAEMQKKYENSNKLIDTYVNATDCPCKNVGVNEKEESISLINPATKKGEFKKEHVGIRTRIGFTYGKFRAKIKFPEMLSSDNVWNGITNAFWMIAQDVNANWNMRRPCDATIAYIPKYEADNEEALKKSQRQNAYSEIDFEIVKESEFWPKPSYSANEQLYKKDDPANDKKIMVTCTNWDLACHEPKKFSIGAVNQNVGGKTYLFNRWADFYKALTTKIPVAHDEIFKAPYYYFEIDWTPEKITWLIGPEKSKMRIICEMDNTITAIPNNQMLMIVTQEWHNQEWWPTAPFKQNFIPFPKKDIIGKVLEFEIE